MDHSFFLKMREALNLSSKFDINIIHYNDNEQQEDSLVPSNIDVDDLKTRFPSHVTNLQLSLAASSDARLWEHSRFFDACFSICRPSYIKSPKPAVRKMIEGKTIDLKDVQLKNPLNGNWEALTCSWNSLLDTLDDHFYLECKLNWLSQ
nr:hypothetical protein [Tanacetum cinerariifolium]